MNAPTTPRPPPMPGAVDIATPDALAGWAWDPSNPDEPIDVEVLDGDTRLAVVRCDLQRPDLVKFGSGGCRYGFRIALGRTLLPLARHTLTVRRMTDGVELAKSPVTIIRPIARLDESVQTYVAERIANEAEQAQSPEHLNDALRFMAAQMARLLERQAQLRPVQDEAQQAAAAAAAEMLDNVAAPHWFGLVGQTLAQRYPPVLLPPVPLHPDASIIIPAFGKFQLSYQCIASIQAALPEASFEVILVDDASPDETLLAPLVFGGTVRVLRNPSNQGFVAACNLGAQAARGRHLLFLNNDTLVRPGWLDALLHTYQTVPKLGVVGAKLLNEDGSLQESGGLIWRLGDGANLGRGAHADEPRFNYLRDVDYVSGAALMLPRPLFEQLGGFDAEFAPGYYEDTDLCFRVRQAGYRVMVQPTATVVHLEGQTSGRDVNGSGMKRFQAINHRKFARRWASVLSQHRLSDGQPEREVERNVRRRALFIDDVTLTPDQDAGSNAALGHIRSLQRQGFKVSFIAADNMAYAPGYTAQLQAMGVECLYAPFVRGVEEHLRSLPIPLDAVYLHRHSNATRYTALVRRFQPQARVVYNVADLHHLRMQREAELAGNAELAAAAQRMRQAELLAVQSVDATIVHSQHEQSLLQRTCPEAHVHVVPWSYPLRPGKTSHAQRRGVMFVGGYRHRPNVDAAKWLVQEIMTLVWAQHPGLPCTLVGSHMPDEVLQLQGPHVQALGQVAELAPLYHQHLLAVAPLRWGAGLKGKVLEAFAHGTPCVMTPTAAEGVALSAFLHQTLVAQDAAGVAAAIIRLHQQAEDVAHLAHLGEAMMTEHYSQAALDAALAPVLQATVPTQAQAAGLAP
ncbi:MAG: glycosyltransferase [Ideonella sp.]|nr:glycosyltransferase [Ideonella sp.]